MLYRLLLLASLFSASLVVTVAVGEGEEDRLGIEDPARLLIVLVSILLALFPEEFGYGITDSRRESVSPIERKRRTVSSVMRELGPAYSRRAYRMSEDSFFVLRVA